MYHIHCITIQAPRTINFERVSNCLWKEWKIVVIRCHDDILAQNYRSSAAKLVQSMYLCLTEGKEKYAAKPKEVTCFMFTFRFHGTSYWRDATEEVPGPGYLINHSSCHGNVSNLSTCLSGEQRQHVFPKTGWRCSDTKGKFACCLPFTTVAW